MSSNESGAGGKKAAPEYTPPGPDAQPAIDLTETVRKRKERVSPTDRLEARFESYLSELKQDKRALQEEVRHLREREIGHLRSDIRWLEMLLYWYSQKLSRLQTSYEWTIAFNWFSFALITVGGGLVSFASFLPWKQEAQRVIAACAFVGLLVGIIIQAINSIQGSRVLLGIPNPPDNDSRPTPNPE